MKTNDIQDRIEKLQAEQIATQNFMNDLPQVFQAVDSLCWYGHRNASAEFAMTFYVSTLEEVKTWVNRWDEFILSTSIYKDGMTTAFYNQESEKFDSDDLVNPVVVTVSKYGLQFEFYAMIKGHLIKVYLKMDKNFNQFAYAKFREWRGRYVANDGTRLVAPAFKGYEYIKWAAGGNHPNSFTMYWNVNTKFEQFFS